MNKGKRAGNEPFAFDAVKGKNYAWCSCGLSKKQPFCDNSHKGTEYRPVIFKIEEAKKIIDQCALVAKKFSINAAIKLQYRNLKNFIHPKYINNNENKHVRRFLETELSIKEFNILVNYIKKKGLIAISTPFDESSVDLCINQKLPIIKVASCSMSDWPLLEKISSTKKPVIISTGGHSLESIDKVYNFFIHRNVDFALMHCVSIYPTPKKDLNLNLILDLKF